MKQTAGSEFMQELLHYYKDITDSKTQYGRLRHLLQRVCRDLTVNDPVQFSNLFSRLNFVCSKTKLPKKKKYQVNHFRVQANKVLQYGYIPSKEEYLQDLKGLAQAISHFYTVPIPAALMGQLPRHNSEPDPARSASQRHNRIRVQVESWDSRHIYAIDEDHPSEEPLMIRYGVDHLNTEFNTTIPELWKGCQLNLVNTYIKNDVYYPEFIVLEPDYLLDVTSLAECYQEYGNHPLYYLYSKLQSSRNNKHFLLGSAANFFLDEFINEKPGTPVNYTEAIKQVFKASPLEFSTCKDLEKPEDFDYFLNDTKAQFASIRETVNKTFKHRDHAISKDNAVLEPAFLSELYGIQGRLDLLETGKEFSKIVELKSGKTPWPSENHALIADNHIAQTYLYSLVIQHVLQIPLDSLRTYIFYSKAKEGNLRLSIASRAKLRQIINTRNLIVSNERKIATDPTGNASRKIIGQINAATLVGNRGKNRFLDQYIIPPINNMAMRFEKASPLEAEYFHSLYAFVSREQYLAKAGEKAQEGNKGLSSLWHSPHTEKLDAGEIIAGLVIHTNNMTMDVPSMCFTIPAGDTNSLPNFRKGDIVVLYERNNPADNVTNKQVFKGTIESISSDQVCIRFRYKQRNTSLFSTEKYYAIEHDMMDLSFNIMYKGLYGFLSANKDRRDLLLNQRRPLRSPEMFVRGWYGSDAMQQVVYKAKAAHDYFILVGPPGTGKTSLALRSMVEEFYLEPEQNILLLAYTNRAVDEICDALNSIERDPPFLRIGNEISCEERHRHALLDKVISTCKTREEVRDRINDHRIFVGTVTAISAKMELFKLKSFQVAIIDEASQLIEPELLPLLVAKDAAGENAIRKFILIGDHKQLPSVVVQPETDSRTNSPELHKIGLIDRRNSLFERLYRYQRAIKNDLGWDMLEKQGRMHPEIAEFPATHFYQGRLKAVPLPHQSAALEYLNYDQQNKVESLVAQKRLLFIPSETVATDKSAKVNSREAAIVAKLVETVFTLYKKNNLPFDPEKSLGIIAPFRSQLAVIKNALETLQIPGTDKITVDTVERFQGSQRDIIIYSFCINHTYQLNMLSNLIKDDGVLIDRKLNVAITRARKQLFITGNPGLITQQIIYSKLLQFMKSKDAYIDCTPTDFLEGLSDLPVLAKPKKAAKPKKQVSTKTKPAKVKTKKAVAKRQKQH